MLQTHEYLKKLDSIFNVCFILKTVHFNDVFFKLPFSRFNCSCSKKKSNKVGPQYVITVSIWKACIMGKNTKIPAEYEAWIIEQ